VIPQVTDKITRMQAPAAPLKAVTAAKPRLQSGKLLPAERTKLPKKGTKPLEFMRKGKQARPETAKAPKLTELPTSQK
jgi:hypothetical protein